MQANTVRPSDMDIMGLASDVCGLLRLQAESKRIHLHAEFEEPVYVYADRDMVHLILRNLISNAIKFTPQEGHIHITAEPDGEMMKISVKDSGVGISQENIQKLFTEYYTSKGTADENGTGLGLMLCKEFLTKNGGQMHVSSEPGKGSIFSFTLPTMGEL
jgi:signal transduction histidine kinase